MEEVAFDQDAHYPAIVPPDFAYGSIKSDADPNMKPWVISKIQWRHIIIQIKYMDIGLKNLNKISIL